MNNKDALAILGKLSTSLVYCQNLREPTTFSELPSIDKSMFLDYLDRLNLSYEFVYDIIDELYCRFYHQEFGEQNTPLSNDPSTRTYSEFDYVCVDTETYRIGVWCEVDGFIAWLDEYGTYWDVDSKEQILKRREEQQKWFDEHIAPIIKEVFDKVYDENQPIESPVTFNDGPNKVKIQKRTAPTLPEYHRNDPCFWDDNVKKPRLKKINHKDVDKKINWEIYKFKHNPAEKAFFPKKRKKRARKSKDF